MSMDTSTTLLTFKSSKTKEEEIVSKYGMDAAQIKLYKDQLSLQSSGLLMLHNVSFKNQGLYTCVIIVLDDPELKHVQLYVGGKFLFEGEGGGERGTEGKRNEKERKGGEDEWIDECMHQCIEGMNK